MSSPFVLRSFNARLRRAYRKFSTNPEVAPEAPKGGVLNWIYRHRQAIVNTIGVYFCFSYAVHNLKLKDAWEKRDAEMADLKEDLGSIRKTLLAEDFLSGTIDSVRSVRDKYSQVHILQSALEEALNAKKKTAADEAKDKVEEMAALTSIIPQEGDNQSGGSKMI